eukprot:scaffold2223_cov46-Cyclotella_meneghiniana.AAC.1
MVVEEWISGDGDLRSVMVSRKLLPTLRPDPSPGPRLPFLTFTPWAALTCGGHHTSSTIMSWLLPMLETLLDPHGQRSFHRWRLHSLSFGQICFAAFDEAKKIINIRHFNCQHTVKMQHSSAPHVMRIHYVCNLWHLAGM